MVTAKTWSLFGVLSSIAGDVSWERAVSERSWVGIPDQLSPANQHSTKGDSIPRVTPAEIS